LSEDDLPRLIRKVWLLLVDHNFQALGQSFPVDISFGDDVCDLKKKVNEEKPEILSHYRVDPSCLSVWKTEGELVIINPTAKRLEEILEKINIDDEDTIRRLGTQVKVADLDLSYGQTLLVRVPGMSRISTTSHIVSSDMICRMKTAYQSSSGKSGSFLLTTTSMPTKICSRLKPLLTMS
jgi:hypothetical protein